jgi:F-type H+-transporting ATPase subunit b
MRIDWWTLALQAVNVLILIWILARFFFRPVAEIIAKRQADANKLLADAAARQQAATDVRVEVDKAFAQIDTERARLIEDARKSAQLEKTNLLSHARQEIGKLRADAEAAIAHDRAMAQEAVIARASELSVQIASRLLARLPSQIGLFTFLDGLRRELEALPPDVRHGLASEGSADAAIEVVTAAQLSEDEVARVRAALKEVLGSEAAMMFRSDPEVIAGIELHSRHTIVRNSWRADLEGIREELSHDEQPSQT